MHALICQTTTSPLKQPKTALHMPTSIVNYTRMLPKWMERFCVPCNILASEAT